MVASTFVSCLALAGPDGIYDAFPGTVHHSVRNFPGPWAAIIGQTPGRRLAHKAPHTGISPAYWEDILGRSGDRGLLGQASTIADRIRADLGQRKNPEQIEKISRSIEPFGR